MADINKTLKDISSLKKKIVKDLQKMIEMYNGVSGDVNKRFNDEFRSSGSMNGLEDFYVLNQILKKNFISSKNSLVIITRMRDISDFNIMEQQIEDSQLEEIFEEDKKIKSK